MLNNLHDLFQTIFLITKTKIIKRNANRRSCQLLPFDDKEGVEGGQKKPQTPAYIMHE